MKFSILSNDSNWCVKCRFCENSKQKQKKLKFNEIKPYRALCKKKQQQQQQKTIQFNSIRLLMDEK
ncbi:hypothetical protein DERF_005396 [Dermatophagoides farinae]|uniref:Uncharacterized protein n=1 Tax=Dermatophagoides farinae TaxID=6954 RepID=A0A922I3X9_DERFA|nr:hypothetical protein DERF_005396 [Dermatophagoides farinae]